MEAGEQLCEVEHRDGNEAVRRDPQSAAQPVPRVGNEVTDALRRREHHTCLRQQRRPRRGQPHPSAAAAEQLDRELALEHGDTGGHRQLHDVEAVCGRGEIELLGNRHEVLPMPQVHDNYHRS